MTQRRNDASGQGGQPQYKRESWILLVALVLMTALSTCSSEEGESLQESPSAKDHGKRSREWPDDSSFVLVRLGR